MPIYVIKYGGVRINVAIAFLCLMSVPAVAAQGSMITNAADLSATLFRQSGVGRRFSLKAEVIAPTIPGNTTLAVKDPTGAVVLNLGPEPPSDRLSGGDRISVTGGISQKDDGLVFADCNPPKILAHGIPPKAIDISPDGFLHGDHQGELVRLSGTILDVFHDEIDTKFMFMVLKCGTEKIYAALSTSIEGIQTFVESLVGLEISIEGICIPLRRGGKQLIGYYIHPYKKSDIKMLSPSFDPFEAPELGNDLFNLTPLQISNLGRRRTSGRVIAAYDRDTVVLKTEDGRIIRAVMTKANIPMSGATIQVVGFPECDLYRINLSRATWRVAPDCKIADETPVCISAKSLQTNNDGKPQMKHKMHGATIRMKGSVLSLPGIGNDDGRLYMKDGDFIVPVNVSTVPDAIRDVCVGCTIEVTGTCIMDSENWRPNSVFPSITGVMIVVRTQDDIRILSRPPWWTPGRLMAVIGTLLAALLGIFVWNRMLNRRAEKRGRELADERLAHVTSDLKVYERTRLAVELHDSLSQNLTGVSLAIRAANRLADSDPDGMRKSLGLAANTLDSCRDELRNCLWDLRNQTLEETDMNEAIRQTLAPHIGDAQLSIRFNVSRERLSDNTAHAILRIVRELATNAVRHGHATQIRIAGAIEDGRLLFSVSDNGGGFDPQTAPGIRQGHFGLQGIRDRIDGFEGDFVLDSSPGKGTKATIAIRLKSSQMTHSSQMS